MPSKAELFEAIRSDARRHELSIRALAELHGVHRRTVRAALTSATPTPRKTRVAQAPKLEPLKPFIDAMLVTDLGAPRKQKHTVRRIWTRLLDEHEAGDLSYSAVRDYVRRRRPQIAAEAGRHLEQAFVPQAYVPGAEAEVDFGDVWVELAGELTKCFLFTLRMSYSGKAVHRVFASQGQEAFVEGHLAAFTELGGVPTDKIRYDNLRSAVSRVLRGRSRTESEHWVRFRSHYGFDAFYCLPGVQGAHEKGGVEGEVGRFRRNHLVPVPVVDTLDQLNTRIEDIDAAEDARRIGSRARTIGADFAVEAALLRPLPVEDFEAGLWLTPRVDRFARVTVRCAHYSVLVRLIGRQVRVRLSASDVVVFDGRVEVARHPRSVRSGSQSLLLDHYLEVLAHKPGALAGATALAQARQDGTFTSAHEALLGDRPRRARRHRWHPSPGRGPAPAPPPVPRRRHHRAARRGRRRGGHRGRRRRRGPQERRPPHPHRTAGGRAADHPLHHPAGADTTAGGEPDRPPTGRPGRRPGRPTG